MLIEEVAARIRAAVSSVRRYLGERKKGRGGFPLPVSPPGHKCKWKRSDIERYIESQNTSQSPPIAPAKKRQQTNDVQRKQKLQEALDRHRTPSTKKGGRND